MAHFRRFRIGLQQKILFMLAFSILIVVIVGISCGYDWAINLFKETLTENHQKMAFLIADRIEGHFLSKAEALVSLLDDSKLIGMIDQTNNRYIDVDLNTIHDELNQKDKLWRQASKNDPIVTNVLDNFLSHQLTSFVTKNNDIAEILIADVHGGLVAASGMTTDFYQADEKWWLDAFAGGQGKFFMTPIDFDQSAQVMSIGFIYPLKNDNQQLVGVAKVVININSFFSFIGDLKFAKSEHVSIIDEKGRFIYHKAKMINSPIKNRFLYDFIYKQERLKSIELDSLLGHKEHYIASKMRLNYPSFADQKQKWTVLVAQDYGEFFKPIRKLFSQMFTLIIILIGVLLFLSWIYWEFVIKAIRQLTKAAKQVSQGNFDVKIDIKTQDELGDLILAFNKMLKDIKEKDPTIKMLRQEIKQRVKSEKELLKNEKFLQNMFESISQPLYVINAKDFKVKWANSAAEKKIENAVISKTMTCFQLTHQQDQPCCSKDHPCPIEKIRKTKKPVITEHIHYVNGQERYVEIHAYPIFDENGELSEMIEHSLDITKRKKMELQLMKQVKNLTQFELEMKKQVDNLSQFKKLSVNREISIVELKKKVNSLSKELGKKEPHDLSFLEKK